MKHPHTQVENETLEALARSPLTGREFRVFLAILRVTNGYHLNENTVSMQYLEQLTGLARNHLYSTLKKLVGKQVISKAKKRGMVACHGPAFWQNLSVSPKVGLIRSPDSPKVGLIQSQGGTELVPVPDIKPASLKKTIKENILKKTTISGPSATNWGAGTQASKYLFEKTNRKRWGNALQKEEFEKAEAEVGFERMKEVIDWALLSGISNIKSILTAAKGKPKIRGQEGGTLDYHIEDV